MYFSSFIVWLVQIYSKWRTDSPQGERPPGLQPDFIPSNGGRLWEQGWTLLLWEGKAEPTGGIAPAAQAHHPKLSTTNPDLKL